MKKTIRLTESDLHRIVKESVKQMLSEGDNGEYVRFNWNIVVPIKYAPAMYKMERQFQDAEWVTDFECDSEKVEMQKLSAI